ncbi:MAG TPA: nuclear transport factor 2 family protein [Thermoleophilaceae bacterium]|nr:nuclear transport factor 2 family protein [Thermoleophilaceae bacterium]
MEARAIRRWSAALNRGHFERAASYFARGAVVEQQAEVRLPDRAAAIAFNRSLPCRADVTDVKRRGATVVAAFRLRSGRAGSGGCSGAARVRFRFSGGKFAEWRQLAEPAADGEIA